MLFIQLLFSKSVCKHHGDANVTYSTSASDASFFNLFCLKILVSLRRAAAQGSTTVPNSSHWYPAGIEPAACMGRLPVPPASHEHKSILKLIWLIKLCPHTCSPCSEMVLLGAPSPQDVWVSSLFFCKAYIETFPLKYHIPTYFSCFSHNGLKA